MAIFILNHFITNYELVIGNLQLYNEQVEQVNSNPYFLNRVYDCASEKDKFPNFITVDFYDVGDCLEVVNILNEFSETSIKEAKAQNIIFPNPSNGIIHLNFADLGVLSPIRITNIQGEEIKGGFILEKTYNGFRLNLSSMDIGYYFLHIGDYVSPVLLVD